MFAGQSSVDMAAKVAEPNAPLGARVGASFGIEGDRAETSTPGVPGHG